MNTRSILVVDDDHAILDMIADLLGYEGYVVRPVGDGSSAIAQARADPPALILLDLMMPELSGWQVIAALRAVPETQAIPIVLLSARRDLATVAQGLDVPRFLEKPFELDDLLKIVREYLPGSHDRSGD